MTREDRVRLRKEFDGYLKEAWRRWLDSDPDGGSSPFMDMEIVPDLDESPGFNHMCGWLTGVADATGWPLDNPFPPQLGPKDWTPGKRRG